jgi:AraC-like DNA-binding protein
MKTTITTSTMDPPYRSRNWHEAIAATYFPLDLQFAEPDRFSGDLSIWQVGDFSLSHNVSASLMYRRLQRHLSAERAEQFLVTVPARSEVLFAQGGKEIRCRPGGFFLERSHEPYEFSHSELAEMWVIKIEAKALAGRIRSPDRFCSVQFDAKNGAGGLFTDMLHLIPARFDTMSAEARSMVGGHLIDLLVLSIQGDERTLTSGTSTVRVAHLSRIESFARRNLSRADLDPDLIARACGISTRYLHELFRDTNQTIGQWIRDQRLEACHAKLRDPANRLTVTEIAYRFGFNDHAQFSRAFRSHFGMSPKELRDRARGGDQPSEA